MTGSKALTGMAGRTARGIVAAGLWAAGVTGAGAQSLPRPGVAYPVTVRFNVYTLPDSGSRVVGFINPGRVIVAGRTTPGGWTEVSWPGSARSIGFAHLTVQTSTPAPSRPPADAVRVYWEWVLGGVGGLAVLWWGARRWTDQGDPPIERWPSTREVVAVQVKWRDPNSFLGPDVVNALDGALRGYKLGERGAAQDARGVIVTPARMGEAGRRQAATLDILCEEGIFVPVPSRIAALPVRRRNRAIGRWYEDQIARWYRVAGFSVDHRSRRLRKADGGIDLICRPR